MTKIIRTITVSTCAALCGLLFAIPANAAAVTFNNLTAITAGTDPVSSIGPLADSFSTSGYATTLNQVSLSLLSDVPSDGGSVRVQLLADASTNPGTAIATIGTFSDSFLSPVLADYTLTLATPFSLAANTRYWIELTSSISSIEWAWSYDQSGPGVASEYFANTYGTSSNAGNAPYQMEVITASPEPSSIAILGIGLVGIAAIGRRKFTS